VIAKQQWTHKKHGQKRKKSISSNLRKARRKVEETEGDAVVCTAFVEEESDRVRVSFVWDRKHLGGLVLCLIKPTFLITFLFFNRTPHFFYFSNQKSLPRGVTLFNYFANQKRIKESTSFFSKEDSLFQAKQLWP
jgi:hypothetical protein